MPIRHELHRGECITSIAALYGLLPETIWRAPENEPLRALRANPNQLVPGDVVYVPDRSVATYKRPVDNRHRFVRKYIRVICRLQLLGYEGSLANVAWRFRGEDGMTSEGVSGEHGEIELRIFAAARAGELELEGSIGRIEFGTLEPVSTARGVQARLANLGFLDGSLESEDASVALSAFVEHADLDQSADHGEILDLLQRSHDELTRAADTHPRPRSASRRRTIFAQRHTADPRAATSIRLARMLRLILSGREGPHVDCRYELWHAGNRLNARERRTGPKGEIVHLIPDVDEIELRVWFDAGDIPEVYRLALSREA